MWFEKHKDDAWASRWIRSDSDSNRVRAGGGTFISAAQKRPDSNYDSSGDDTTSDDGDESKQQQEGGGSPLHLALEKKLPAAVSLALLARWRDAAKVSDSVGNYPLMIALKSSAATALCCLARSGRHEERRGRDCAVPCHAKMPRKQWWTQYELRHQIVRCFQPF